MFIKVLQNLESYNKLNPEGIESIENEENKVWKFIWKYKNSRYNAISYFGKKTNNKDTNIVNPRLKLPFRIDNRNLVFQVTKVGGIAPQLNDKKIKNFSILSSMEKVQKSKKKKK